MRPTNIVLDTSAYSRLRAGHEGAIEAVASAEVVRVPTIVIGELEAGFQLGSRYAENRQVLGEFLDEPFVIVVPVSQAVAVRYGRIFMALRRAGTPIPVNDIWIAAITMQVSGHLITFDGDFARIAGLDFSLLE